jgi:Ca2+-binding RTX toxin-like protein
MTIFFATLGPDTAALAGIAGDEVSFANATINSVISLNPFVVQTGWAAGDQYSTAITIFTLSNHGDFFSGDGRNLTIYGGTVDDAVAMHIAPGNLGKIYGGTGEDTFISSAGFEIFDGGSEGQFGDTVAFNDSTVGVTASLADQSINTGQAKGDIYIDIENLQGSIFGDTLYAVADGKAHQLIGDPGILDGIGGNDTLYGATGANAGFTNFIGGAGADTFHLGDGGNLIDYEIGAVGLIFSLTNGALNTGDAAGDILIGLAGRNVDIAGTIFSDTLYGDAGNNNILGDPYNDPLYGVSGGNDQLFGLGGDDILMGGVGADTLDGGIGYNYASYSLSRSGLQVDLGTPANGTGEAAGDVYINVLGIFGSAFNDTLRGDAGNNIIRGQGGNDQIFGGAGDDLFNGGLGADSFDGGIGYDVVTYNDSTTPLTIDLTTPANNTGEAAGDTYAVGTIEGVTGSVFADSITGATTATVIDGNLGNDTIHGGAGNDGIFGGAGADMLFGGGGVDNFTYRTVSESSGANIDTIADFVTGQDSLDLSLMIFTGMTLTRTLGGGTTVTANVGGTTFQVNVLTNIGGTDIGGLTAGITVLGSANGEALIGSVFGDTILGGLGADTITASLGADVIRYTAASQSTPAAADLITDFLTDVDKLDFSTLAPTNVSLVANAGVIEVSASTGGSTILVKSTRSIFATDILGVTAGITTAGSNSGETLKGTKFNDTLQGNGGGDALFGGQGADTFVYANRTDSVSGNADILLDFTTGEDKIDLSLIGLSTGSPQQLTLQYDADGSTTLFAVTNSGAFTLGATSYLATADIIGMTKGVFLIGSLNGEALVGTASTDIIDGNDGADTMTGGAGADVFRYFDASDSTPAARDLVTDFQTGVDSFDLGGLAPTLVTLTRGLTTTLLSATAATGNMAVDVTGLVNGSDLVGVPSVTLVGNSTGELLVGTGGNDTIIGGDGQDTMTGGAGSDVFRFLVRSNTPNSAPDSITDFQSGFDKIDLTGFGATGVTLNSVGPITQITGSTLQGLFQINVTGAILQTDILGLTAGGQVNGNNTAEVLNGTPFNDTLQGNGGGDVLTGGDGADLFVYALRTDSAPGSSDLLMDFATGVDKIDLSQIGLSNAVALQATLQHLADGSTALSATTITGAFQLGAKTFIGVDDIIGLTKGVYVIGAAVGETLVGSAFNDIIDGNGGADTITGGAGADSFRYFTASDSTPAARDQITDFQSGLDSFDFGGLGATAVTLTRGGTSTTIIATAPSGSLAIEVAGLVNASDMVGVIGGLTLIGNTTGEALAGTGGNDTIIGGDGQDTMTGGAGSDVFRFLVRSNTPNTTPDSITDFQSGFDKIDLTGFGATGVSLVRTGGVTQISGSTPQGAFQINSTVVVLATDILGLTTGVIATGDNTAEVLNGTAFDDTIQGNGGGDVLTGGTGADLFVYALRTDSAPGSSDLLIDFATGVDKLDLSQIGLSNAVALQATLQHLADGSTSLSATTITGAFQLGAKTFVGADDIIGLTKGVFVIGAAVAETLTGSAFNDIIDGNGGADTITGGAGADSFRYFTASDSTPAARDQITDFQTGLDSFDFGGLAPTAVTLTRGANTTTITATAPSGSLAIDVTGLVNGSDMIGVSGGMTLIGNSGAEALSGAGGNDTIIGGDGQDTLTGGGGSDIFRFTLTSHSTSAAPDSITDFQSGFDQIDLTTLGVTNVILLKTPTGTQITGDTPQGSLQINVTGAVLATDILGLSSGVSVRGDNTAETVKGSPFADTLQGSGGADALFGGLGADVFRFALTSDSVAGNSDIIFDFVTGSDKLDLGLIGLSVAGAQQVTLQHVADGSTNVFGTTTSGNLVLGVTTFVSATDIIGLTRGVFVIGGAVAETLAGSDFADYIDGNGGADTMSGGDGADIFRYLAAADSTVGAPDMILDFQAGVDKFDLGGLNPSSVNVNRLNGGTTITVVGSGGTTVFKTATTVNLDDFITFFGTPTVNGDGSFLGSAYGDKLVGDGGANTINGAAGDDTLIGGTGADSLIGGGGLDMASYASSLIGLTARLDIPAVNTGDAAGDTYNGINGLTGSGFADVLVGDGNGNSLYAGGGDDYLAGLAGNDQLSGEAGNDILDAGAGNDTLDGGTGNDTLDGGAGADSLIGGGGFDMVSYGSAATGIIARLDIPAANTGDAAGDIYTAIAGFFGSGFGDVLVGDGNANSVYGGGGADYLAGLAGNDQLFGEAGNDILDAGAGNDTLNGGAGNDTLDGGAGADSMIGGGGFDLVSYGSAAAGLTARLDIPAANTGDAAGDTYSGIAGFFGSGFGDVLVGDSNANSVYGGGGGDYLAGLAGNDQLFGEAGNDILDGGAGNDTLDGGGGDDILDGGAGADSFVGGGGVDMVTYGSAAAGLTARLDIPAANTGDAAGDSYSGITGFFGSGLNDVLVGDGNANTIYGGGGGDYLAGLAGADQLFGETGNDILDGGAGNDTLNGGGGDDILDGGAGADSLIGGGGVDMVTYGTAATGITAWLQFPSVNTGDAAGDTYTGISGLIGSRFADFLLGDGNANSLNGGGGNDLLYGGVGSDSFVFNAAAFGVDTVQDFATTAAAGVNHDFLDFRGSGIANLGAVTMNQVGADTHLVTSQGTVILQNIIAGTLAGGDFLF